jgi:hypothetical protein
MVTKAPAPADGQLESESTEFVCLADGKCKRAIAIDTAQNAVRFGPWKRAQVFAGRDIGRMIYQVESYDDPSPNEFTGII